MPHEPPPNWVRTRRRAIGLQLRTARRTAGLTQIHLADRIGRDHKTISRWENGHRVPDLDDLILLADAIGVPLRELVS